MQTIYSIDYLNSISKEKLWKLAKMNPMFSLAAMERELNIPKDNVRYAIKFKQSKYDKKIKKYLVEFLTATSSYDNNLEDLFLMANKHQKVTFTQIAKDLNCNQTTISESIHGKRKAPTAYKIQKYLENIINKYEPRKEQEQMSNELNLEELFDKVNNFQKLTKKQIAEDLNCAQSAVVNSINGTSKGGIAHLVKEYLENIIIEQEQLHGAEFSKEFNLDALFKEANKYQKVTKKQIAEDLNCNADTVSLSISGQSRGETAYRIKEYLENIIKQYKPLNEEIQKMQEQYLAQEEHNQNLDSLFKEAHLTNKEVAEALELSLSTVSLSRQGKTKGRAAYKIKEFLENVIEHQNKMVSEILYEYYGIPKESEYYDPQEESKEQETMTEETLTDTKEMKTYDEFLNFINTQKELPIVKKALDETLSENQNLEKILAKEEFITIETAQELNEKIFANEYTEAEILDFENQYYGTVNDDSLKDKIKAFVEKHNLSLETALKLLQISEEDYKKMLEGADKVSNKTADKLYKAISAFDEFYHSEKTQDTINNTKNTFVTGFAIALAKSQTFLNKGLNKFADFLNKSADKIKNSNSENKED